MRPTTNVLQKTFLIRQGGSVGSAFAVEFEGREYLATARHVVASTKEPICVFHNESWKTLPITGIIHHPGNPDVAAITLNKQLAPRYPMNLTAGGTEIGEEALIVGFPFGWHYTQFDINNGYPIPFEKAAILSAYIFKNQTSVIYLDGHNNPGFSGGPIATDHVNRNDPKSSPKIIGVVSSYPPERTPHPSEFSPALESLDGYRVADDHVHPTNSGFICGYGIKHVIEIIQTNPHGHKLAE